MTGPARSSSRSGRPPCAASAIHGFGASSSASSGTRKIAPTDARSAFAPSGSAQPAESATAAPKASAARSRVPTLPGSATRQSPSVVFRSPRGRSGLPVDADRARRVRQRRELGEQLRLDGLAGDEQLDRLDPCRARRLDEILALDDEEPELVPLALLREQLPHELQRRVRARRDHASHSSQAPWKSACATSSGPLPRPELQPQPPVVVDAFRRPRRPDERERAVAARHGERVEDASPSPRPGGSRGPRSGRRP